MASATLTPYKNNTQQETFQLVSTTQNGAEYKVSGRDLSAPYSVIISRKIGVSGSKSNDHVKVIVRKINTSVDTGPVTGSVSIDVSIPRSTSVLSKAEMTEVMGVAASLLNDAAALAATTTNRGALLEGRDL